MSKRPSAPTKPPPILRLPPDIWLLIFAHLPRNNSCLATLSSLALTCRRLSSLVDSVGWSYILLTQYPSISQDSVKLEHYYRRYLHSSSSSRTRTKKAARSRSWFALRYIKSVERGWDGVVLRSGSIDISTKAESGKATAGGARGGGGRRFGGSIDFAIPTLAVGAQWIIVGVRSELFLHHANANPKAKDGAGGGSIGKLAIRLKLHHRTAAAEQNGNDGQKRQVEDDPWQDITSLRLVDEKATRLAIGFADGSLQVVELVSSATGEGKSPEVNLKVVYELPSLKRQEVADLASEGECWLQ